MTKEARDEFLTSEEEDDPVEFAHLNQGKHEINFEEEFHDLNGNNPSPGSFLAPKHLEDGSYESLMSKLNE